MADVYQWKLTKLRAEILSELAEGRMMSINSWNLGGMIGRDVQPQTVEYFTDTGMIERHDNSEPVTSYGNGYVISRKGKDVLQQHISRGLERNTKSSPHLKLGPKIASKDQLQYANKLGITIPDDATMEDMSCLISNKISYDKPSTQRHRDFATQYGITVSSYIGKKGLFNIIHRALSAPGNEKELIAWFAFRIYRGLVDGSMGTPIQGPEHVLFQRIATQFVTNSKILKSIARYKGSDLIWFGVWSSPDGEDHSGGSTQTTAYKEISSALQMII